MFASKKIPDFMYNEKPTVHPTIISRTDSVAIPLLLNSQGPPPAQFSVSLSLHDGEDICQM